MSLQQHDKDMSQCGLCMYCDTEVVRGKDRALRGADAVMLEDVQI